MAGGLFGDCGDQEGLQSFTPCQPGASFPLRVPLASASVTHGSHHILLFLTPCSNKRTICLSLKSVPSVRTSLQRKQPGP